MLNKLDSIDKLINCLQLQVANLPTYAVAVGSTAGDLLAITNGLANLIYIRDYSEIIDANKKTVFQIKAMIYNGDPDGVVPAMPVFPAADFPEDINAGELERAQIRNRRFRLGPGYTEEIGIALGIEHEAGGPTPEVDIKPTIEAFSSQSGYMFSLVVSKREKADMWTAQILRSGDAVWQNAGTFSGKAADVTITPTTPGQPEQLQVRVHLRKNNTDYGIVSDATYVTVNP